MNQSKPGSCKGCKYDGKYFDVPVHWCEMGSVPRRNDRYPTPFDDCPLAVEDDGSKVEDYW